MIPKRLQEPLEDGIVRLIESHSGDGTVLVPKPTEPRVLQSAIALGLMSADGFLTSEGRRLLARLGNGQPNLRG